MRYLHMVCLLMPKSHRDTMEVLFVFLKWVASFAHLDAETGSKMDLGNLATVICPSILYARGRDAMRDETFGSLRVMTLLLENQDEFFTVPVEFLPILHDQDYFANSVDMPGKDFMKKCDTYMRVKAGNSRPPPGTPHNGSYNGGSPRYPPVNSPIPERPPPPMGNSFPSDRNIRPHPGMPPPVASYPPPGSPSIPQTMMQNSPRSPPVQADEWTPPSRPMNVSSSPSRPSSYIQSRPSTDQSQQSQSNSAFPPPNSNGYPSVVRQRT